jgi:hypothetical protein
MNDYVLLMHDDTNGPENDAMWGPYLGKLRASGAFDGGSSIGSGACFRKDGTARPVTGHLTGFLRVRATSLEDAQRFLVGNPVYEAGGTVEIRELPKDG